MPWARPPQRREPGTAGYRFTPAERVDANSASGVTHGGGSTDLQRRTCSLGKPDEVCSIRPSVGFRAAATVAPGRQGMGGRMQYNILVLGPMEHREAETIVRPSSTARI